MISQEEFKERRKKVLTYLEDCSNCDGVKYKAVFHSGEHKTFANDVKYPFRVDSDFYYLTGFTEADATCVLDPYSDNPYQLYVQAYDPLHAIWEGHREGLEGAKKNFGADASYESEEFNDSQEPDTNKNSSKTKDALNFVHALRFIKSESEIALMRKSVEIAVQAHRIAKEIITPGIYEYEVEAAMYQVFRSKGANGWAYPAIVASGKNACTLHYITNNKIIEKNDLILIDAGAEYQYYASDLTRVHHASDSMSQEQKDIYDLTLSAQKAAIESVKPGGSFKETHEITSTVIGEGLQDLGYIKDKNDPEQIRKYFMHGTGHSIGIDVHDCYEGKETKYVPGSITTVEPGIYIAEKNIGVRIEDDVLVTKTGYDVLSADLVK